MSRFIEKELKSLLEKVVSNNPKAKTSVLEEAYFFSKIAHKDQKRLSGEPYFSHPLAVANSLADFGFDEIVVSSALLHDVVEDSNISLAELRRLFGKDIANLVSALTKLDLVAFRSRKEHTAANVVKTIIASSKDLRVLIIKLFDKLHNLETLSYLDKERRIRIASDALLVYVPITQRLGLNFLKRKMEDLCYANLEPRDFKKFKKSLMPFSRAKDKEISKIIKTLKKQRFTKDWSFLTFCKSFYSLRMKMRVRGKKIEELNDIKVLKIIVPSKKDCYFALGAVHEIFKPIPKKFKDYIATPSYLYQALHTQVISPKNKPVKIYIQSKEMFELGEYGIIYLFKSKSKRIQEFKKIFYLNRNVKYNDSKELISDLKLDFLNKSIVVFTANGEMIKLPSDSTVIDFAYLTDPTVADKSIKAEVNGRIVPLWTKLFDGDRVKVIHAKKPTIQISWLCFATSEKVKKDIESTLKNSIIPLEISGHVKFRIDSIDKPGLVGKQAKILADNGFNIESGITKVNEDRKTGYSEFIVKNLKGSNLQKAIEQLKKMKETIKLNVDYFK
ncbi:MAG: HD domain-containing protein [Candidatus Diapherotrites archaeon]